MENDRVCYYQSYLANVSELRRTAQSADRRLARQPSASARIEKKASRTRSAPHPSLRHQQWKPSHAPARSTSMDASSRPFRQSNVPHQAHPALSCTHSHSSGSTPQHSLVASGMDADGSCQSNFTMSYLSETDARSCYFNHLPFDAQVDPQLPPPSLGLTAPVSSTPLGEPAEKVLVGLGLYDSHNDQSPSVHALSPPHVYHSAPASILGKGLKLEETWEPPVDEQGLADQTDLPDSMAVPDLALDGPDLQADDDSMSQCFPSNEYDLDYISWGQSVPFVADDTYAYYYDDMQALANGWLQDEFKEPVVGNDASWTNTSLLQRSV